MKVGINLLLWTSHVTTEHFGLLRDLKAAGYDTVEIPVFQGSPDHYAMLGAELDRLGLERSVSSAIGPAGKNPLSPDKAAQQAAVAFTRWLIDCTVAIGTRLVVGPIHSELGFFTGDGPTETERQRAIGFHRAVGDYAGERDVRLALEALNRFECYFLNTMAQLADHLDAVDHPAVKAMYDTFHANIEETDPVQAISTIRRHLIHVHVSENDRGIPGRGHVPWEATYRALRTAGYDDWITIEAFGRALPELAAATRVWRDFFPSRDTVYREGLVQVRQGWAKAQ
jgi:D-psicose/D-tagatose/L-ribulose 3-epimerase